MLGDLVVDPCLLTSKGELTRLMAKFFDILDLSSDERAHLKRDMSTGAERGCGGKNRLRDSGR